MAKQQELVQRELEKVIYADLSNYDKETNTYHIPRVETIRLRSNHCYIVNLKASFFRNSTLRTNYNHNTCPTFECCMIDVLSSLGKLIRINAIEYDIGREKALSNRWSGYVYITDLDVIKEI